jgi:malonyl-CoA/methylmalonyl-CoA synthetase
MSNPLYDTLFGGYIGSDTPFIETIDGKITTHGNFVAIASRLANAFHALGLKKGDRVAIQAEKSVTSLCVYAACIQSGVIFLPLNTGYTTAEVGYFIDDSGAKLFICDEKKVDDMKPILEKFGVTLKTLNADGTGSITDLAKQQKNSFSPVDTNGDDLAAFLYTSGTTGKSKGAMLTQNNLLSNSKTLTKYWKFNDQDVLLHALPIFHTHGLFVAVNVSLMSGCKIILMPRFDVSQILDNMPKATVLMGVPTFYTRLLSETAFDAELTKNMHLFISGSAPLLAETHIEFENCTGHRILERYGMTETNMSTSNPYDGERRAGTVGFALPGVEIKITDPESGLELATGEIGNLEVRGPNVFKGYWNMPEKTKEELREDGFFITGDLGLVDEDGYLQIIGREKDLIISGGFNVYPKEIELVLDDQPGVVESAVIGVPHPDFGETPLGILVIEDTNVEFKISVIENKIFEKLARYKHPRKLIIMNQLPRNTMGKVQKNVLREKYKEIFLS